MFEKFEPLDAKKHIDLKFNTSASYLFAQKESIVPLSYKEVSLAAKYYPIVFPGEGSVVPQALLSFTRNNNAFITAEGRWIVPYVPAHIRRYPFILAKTDDEGNYALCIDPEAPHFQSEGGDPLYTANGEPTDFLNKAMNFLKQYQQDMNVTRKITAVLDEKGLLAPKQLTIEQGGQQSVFQAGRAVEPEKLNEIDDKTLGEWVKQGVMGVVYAHLHSLSNFQDLAKRQQMQTRAA